MPAHQEFTEMLQKITTYLDSIQLEVQDSIDGQTDSGEPLSGYSCQYGSHSVDVVGCPTWEFFQVRYSFDLAQLLAVQQAGRETTGRQVTLDATDVRDARRELVDRLSEEEHADLRLELIVQLSNSSHAVALVADEADRVSGLTITRKIFVYDEFGVGDFDRAVQRTVNLGWQGKELLVERYGIREEFDVAGSGANAIDDDVGPSAFQ